MTADNKFFRAASLAALLLVAAAAAVFYVLPSPLESGIKPDGAKFPAAVAGEPQALASIEPLELVTADGIKSLQVEVARTPEQQMMGLMFRKSLADDRGMLFEYETREITMWMKNTYIPLDMVFIKADGIIHRIEAMTEPHSERVIASEGNVAAVLEIAGGNASRLGLKPGDKVKHRYFATK